SRPAGGSVYQASAGDAPATPRSAPTPPPLSTEPLPPVMPHASAPPRRSSIVAERAVVDPRALSDAPQPSPGIAPQPVLRVPTSTVDRAPAPQIAAVEEEWVIEDLPLEPAPLAAAASSPTIAAAPTPPTAAVASDGHYVQAGAFGDASKAERIRDRLAAIGPSLVEPVSSNGRSLYRVRVGPFANRGAAALTRDQVAAAGFPDALTIAK
ncbi:MAG: SPOR domain-containing protein, partial [Pseudomonadota bacterium]